MNKMPMLFIGHGSPMNAIEPDNIFNQGIVAEGQKLTKPKAILMISAHWYSRELQVMSGEQPSMMYDFHGFPDELNQVIYPAHGLPDLAAQVQQLIDEPVQLNAERGFDHGAWAVLKYLFPDADVPVVQLSIKRHQSPEWHIHIAKQLATLREQGVLIVGSGNIVHNLGAISWQHIKQVGAAFDWAVDFQTHINQAILSKDIATLAHYADFGQAAQLAVPTDEHYLPLLYIMALSDEHDTPRLFNDTYIGGSLSMTSVVLS
ncbi:MAG: 4,5-DOPA dioxygenase extradiol [Acinetobacter sp.]|nr:4,5-DOPA dioxygenase extradiol [Acinetobacter sp.]